MKKSLKVLCALALFATVPTVLTSCGETSSVVDENQEIVNAALQELNVIGEASANFNLVISARGGVVITWASDNEAITINGSDAVVNPSTEKDVSVKLTATATKGNATGTREFTVVVKQKVIDVEYISISEALAAALNTTVTIRGIVSHIFYTYTDKTTNEVKPSGFNLSTNEGTIYCYGTKSASSVSRGDELIVSGTTTSYPTTVTHTTQLTNINVVDTIKKNASLSFTDADLANYETKTVAEIASDGTGDYYGKTYIMRDVRINKYNASTYTSMGIYDWKDTFSSSDPKINLYSSNGQSPNTMSEYDWLNEYLDKKVDLLFTVNSQNSSQKWRGAPVAILKA